MTMAGVKKRKCGTLRLCKAYVSRPLNNRTANLLLEGGQSSIWPYCLPQMSCLGTITDFIRSAVGMSLPRVRHILFMILADVSCSPIPICPQSKAQIGAAYALLMLTTSSWSFLKIVDFGENSISCSPETHFGKQNRLFCFSFASAVNEANARRG